MYMSTKKFGAQVVDRFLGDKEHRACKRKRMHAFWQALFDVKGSPSLNRSFLLIP
jgi:hypothetical protein